MGEDGLLRANAGSWLKLCYVCDRECRRYGKSSMMRMGDGSYLYLSSWRKRLASCCRMGARQANGSQTVRKTASLWGKVSDKHEH